MDYKKIYNNFKESKEKGEAGPDVIYPKAGGKKSEFTFNKLWHTKPGIFLAGPCPRSDYRKTDWRGGAVDILRNLCYTGAVYNPTNEWYDTDNTDELVTQTHWEKTAMCIASAIVFYLARSEKFPGFTSNCEFAWWMKSPSVYVVIPEGDTKNANRYISIKAKEYGRKVFTTLEDCLAQVVRDLSTSGNVWYTSDTHFGQERTLTLSKRPFMSVDDMDLELISNWNKRIHVGDTVYHLGDFGERADYLDCLNFGKLNFITGNYERDKLPEVLKDIKKYENVEVFDPDECTVDSGEYHFILRHEPVTGKAIPKDALCLFGHIHGRTLIKNNGIDVGVDGHMYCPMSQDDVNFLANAIIKGYYDENVMENACK